MAVKGTSQLIGSNITLNGTISVAVDCRQANSVSIQVLVAGSNPSAVLTVQGASAEGGNYLALPDINATQTVTENTSFDVVVGQPYVKVNLSSISGDFSQGGGFTIWVTPWISPGSPRVAASIVVDTLSAITANTGALSVSGVCSIGTSGGIYQGTGTFASPTTGLKISNSSGQGIITEYLNGSKLWELTSAGLWFNPVISRLSGAGLLWSASGVQYLSIGMDVDLGDVTGVMIENLSALALTIASDAGIFLATSKLGFFGTPPASKPTVVGSRGSNAALASVLTALAGLGLLTDSSTA